MSTTDIVNRLAGIASGSALDLSRNHRLQTRLQTEQAYRDLFEPQDPVSKGFPVSERLLVAVFTAELHQQPEIAAHYAGLLERSVDGDGLLQAVAAQARIAATTGPYGFYPDGPLSRENVNGKVYQTQPSVRDFLGAHLAAALAHTHFLIFRPRDAKPEFLQELTVAGWSTIDIVTLSQLVSFLTYQIRVVTGLRVFAATTEAA